ncbi:MAG: NADH-quinone oxidoreductase subunit I, partial [Balneolaceae bacterium]|nr:NADH-quinone oxidoreductase subunit I [Balneolaceae bacterium]
MPQPQNLEQPVANALNDDYDRERSLSLLEKLYLPEIFKALWYSFKQMLSPTFTMRYPEEKWDPPAIFRGRPVLVED